MIIPVDETLACAHQNYVRRRREILWMTCALVVYDVAAARLRPALQVRTPQISGQLLARSCSVTSHREGPQYTESHPRRVLVGERHTIELPVFTNYGTFNVDGFVELIILACFRSL